MRCGRSTETKKQGPPGDECWYREALGPLVSVWLHGGSAFEQECGEVAGLGALEAGVLREL